MKLLNYSQLFPQYKAIKNVGINLISKNKYNNNKLQVLKDTTTVQIKPL